VLESAAMEAAAVRRGWSSGGQNPDRAASEPQVRSTSELARQADEPERQVAVRLPDDSRPPVARPPGLSAPATRPEPQAVEL
jgi:hypothetical protein